MRNWKKYIPLARLNSFQRFVAVVAIFLLIWVVGSGINSRIQDRLIETMTVESETVDVSISAYGFIHADVVQMQANHSGNVEKKAAQGERVAKNQPVFAIEYKDPEDEKKQEKKEYLAPQSGIVNYHIDGHAQINDFKSVSGLDLKGMYEAEKGKKNNKQAAKAVQRDEAVATIIDNLRPATLYMTYDPEKNSIFKEPGDVFRMRFPDENEETVATVEEIEKIGDATWCKINLGPMSDLFLQNRVVQVEAYRREKAVLRIAPSAIVYRKGEPGLYTVKNSLIVWRPVTIIEERQDEVSLEVLPAGTVIITTPGLVREGNILK